jgi:glyoxylase-like metal-dependent hydrolase (beta-lactamase superfamily II)
LFEVCAKMIIVGDGATATGRYPPTDATRFPGGVGRVGSLQDFDLIYQSVVDGLFVLPDETWVYPGHGTTPP